MRHSRICAQSTPFSLMSEASLRIGIIGTGSMGRTHAAAWATTPARIAGFVSRASTSALALQHGAPVFASLEALLPHVDVVDICTPTPQHAPQAIRAARTGKHVVCEKPMARTLSDAQAMHEACRTSGVVLLIAHVLRYFPAYAKAREQLRSGALGALKSLALYRAGSAPTQATGNWFADLDASGGPLLDLLIHDIDYARWLAGEVDSVQATAQGTFNDHALITLQHHSGVETRIEGGWHLAPGQFQTRLHVTGATARFFAQSGFADGADTAPIGGIDPYHAQAADFYQALRTGVTPRVTAEDGLGALQIALAAIESARMQRVVLLSQ
jgi:myo-inositol 2-dehydrogenase / D-chiro-inositol 1-dehydrogenase